MKLTAKDLYDLNVIDKIIEEPENDFDILTKNLKMEIVGAINKMSEMSKVDIVNDRYTKFRNMGEYVSLNK